MVWRVEQRGLGEQMIEASTGSAPVHGLRLVPGQPREAGSVAGAARARPAGITDEGRVRLTKLQHLLLQLVNRLDKDHLRYPFEMNAA